MAKKITLDWQGDFTSNRQYMICPNTAIGPYEHHARHTRWIVNRSVNPLRGGPPYEEIAQTINIRDAKRICLDDWKERCNGRS